MTGSARSYAASGVQAGQRIVSTYNAGPFVAGRGTRRLRPPRPRPHPGRHRKHERLSQAIELLRPDAVVLTPSYAAYLVERPPSGHDLAGRASGASRGR